MPTSVLTISADTQHRRSALPSALISFITSRHKYSRASHETSTPHHCSHFPLNCSSDYLTDIYAYPLQSYLAITSDHYSHRSLHNGPPFLLSTFLFILPIPFGIHCLVSHTISQYHSPPLTISSYTASLSATPPYAHPFPFLSFSFLSHSHWFYHYIFILTLIYLSSHWLDYSSFIVLSIPLVPTGQ
jgi:hypothetical protein